MHLRLAIFICLAGVSLSGCDARTDLTPEAKRLNTLVNGAQLLEVDQERAMLSIFQLNAQLTFIAGGGVGPESGVIYRMENNELIEEETPVGPALWWLWGNAAGQLWACGDRGRILKRSADGEWQEESTPIADDTILYGIWGNASGQLWAVGGSYRRTGEQNIVLTSNGNGVWTRLMIPNLPADFTFFKVWGENPTWIVGDLGWVLKISGDNHTFTQSESKQVLFTVHGNGDDVVAVGGQSGGQIYGLTSTNMIREHLSGDGSINGVYVRDDNWRVAAGDEGRVLLSSSPSRWAAGTLFPGALSQRTIHGVSSGHRTLFVGGDMRRMSRGFVIVSTDLDTLEEAAE